METTLIIIVLLLIGAFNLITIGVLALILFKLKVFCNSPSLKETTSIPTPAPSPTEEEEEKARRQRKAYEDQLSAINEMLNYNADVAYGIKPKDEY